MQWIRSGEDIVCDIGAYTPAATTTTIILVHPARRCEQRLDVVHAQVLGREFADVGVGFHGVDTARPLPVCVPADLIGGYVVDG